jgi:membrane dipeptidase
MIIVDSHEDIAWNMLTFGRDYTRSVEETRRFEIGSPTVVHNGQTLLGWDEWVRGRVAIVFSSIYATPIRRREGLWEKLCYSDEREAGRLYREQLDVYQRLVEEQEEKFALVRTRSNLDDVLLRWEADEPTSPMVGLVIAMEGADAIRAPSELEEWFERGVRIIGPSWVGTRYAGGTHEPGPLTDAGRELLDAMADFGIVLDLSHMAEEAALEALDRYSGNLIASHSNVRALLSESDQPDRHLSDVVIDRIAEHQGVIGIIPYNKFLLGHWRPGDPRDWVTLEHVIAHIDYICQRVGDALHVAIGSDFDGGFGLDKIPIGLDSIADLRLIGEALRAWGYAQEDVKAIMGENWLNILFKALPER